MRAIAAVGHGPLAPLCRRQSAMVATSALALLRITPITSVCAVSFARLASSSSKKGKAPVAAAAAASAPSKSKGGAAAAAEGGRAGVSRSTPVSGAAGRASAAEAAASASAAGNGIEGDVIMSVRGLTKMLPGGRTLFKDVSLGFQRGAKIGVLGLNGSGKSSLLKVLAGVDPEFDGTVWRADGLRLGYLMQEPMLDNSKSVHDNIMDGLREKTDLLARYEQLSVDMSAEDVDPDQLDALMSEQAEVQAKIEQLDCWNLAHTVETAKTALRVPPDDADVSKLSGGEKRRVALCRLLLEEPEVLLLDEPTNHLDAESVAWLERFLQSYKGTVLAITHDRYFLDNVAGWILELDRGQAFAYQGNYSMWLQKKSARLDMEKKQERKRAKAMEEELAWIRQGARVSSDKRRDAALSDEPVQAVPEHTDTWVLCSSAEHVKRPSIGRSSFACFPSVTFRSPLAASLHIASPRLVSPNLRAGASSQV